MTEAEKRVRDRIENARAGEGLPIHHADVPQMSEAFWLYPPEGDHNPPGLFAQSMTFDHRTWQTPSTPTEYGFLCPQGTETGTSTCEKPWVNSPIPTQELVRRAYATDPVYRAAVNWAAGYITTIRDEAPLDAARKDEETFRDDG